MTAHGGLEHGTTMNPRSPMSAPSRQFKFLVAVDNTTPARRTVDVDPLTAGAQASGR